MRWLVWEERWPLFTLFHNTLVVRTRSLPDSVHWKEENSHTLIWTAGQIVLLWSGNNFTRGRNEESYFISDNCLCLGACHFIPVPLDTGPSHICSLVEVSILCGSQQTWRCPKPHMQFLPQHRGGNLSRSVAYAPCQPMGEIRQEKPWVVPRDSGRRHSCYYLSPRQRRDQVG